MTSQSSLEFPVERCITVFRTEEHCFKQWKMLQLLL